MVEADREVFDRLMTTLAEVYGECSILKRQAFWMALQEHPFSAVEFAAQRCLQTRKTHDNYPPSWPTPGDLIGLMYRDLDNTPDPDIHRDRRKALPAAPPDPEERARIRKLIHDIAKALPNSGKAVERKNQAVGSPKSRQDRLREMFTANGDFNHIGGLAALALDAGYEPDETLEAIKAVFPDEVVKAGYGPQGVAEAMKVVHPNVEGTDQPWV